MLRGVLFGLAVGSLAACVTPSMDGDDGSREGGSYDLTETHDACADHGDGVRCHAKRRTMSGGERPLLIGPQGLRPSDLQQAYNIDPDLGDGITVAVIDAFGYPDLESDLATYRSQFGLPECSIANGCLRIVNESGETSPLPPISDPSDDWTGETALDIDMISAACPKCKILVVQTGADGGFGLDVGQAVAVRLGADAISDSWGGTEFGDVNQEEGHFNNPGVGTFASTGDNGNNAGRPQYPSTSVFVVAVGGTTLRADVTQIPRGFTETAWSGAGSSCSNSIAKPDYQANVPTTCTTRAASDLSAVADPQFGVAIFDSDNGNGGWNVFGGTSASSPLMAALFAAAGHSDITPAFVYKHPEIFTDIVDGSNGPCGAPQCDAGGGWDGPTGLGVPDQQKVKAIGNAAGTGPAVQITFPAANDTVATGFTIEVASDANPAPAYVLILVDGVIVGRTNTVPFDLSAPVGLKAGKHTIEARSFDIDRNSNSTMLDVTLSDSTGGGDDDGGGGGGCSTSNSGRAGGLTMAGIGLALALSARRRRN